MCKILIIILHAYYYFTFIAALMTEISQIRARECENSYKQKDDWCINCLHIYVHKICNKHSYMIFYITMCVCVCIIIFTQI